MARMRTAHPPSARLARILRVALLVPAALLLAGMLALVLVPPFLDRVYHAGPASDHFDGQRFFNPEGVTVPALDGRRGNIVTFALTRLRTTPWPAVPVRPVDPAALPPLAPGGMRAIWIGHATVLVQAGHFNILTDPVWANRVGPFGLLGPERRAAPGIALERLPRIDLILVSHNHYDHLDQRTLRAIWQRDRPAIVTPLGNDRIIAAAGAQAIALDWGGRVTLRPGLAVRVLRSHHWSSRWYRDRNRALWGAFMVETPAGRIFFAGDTGWGDGAWVDEAVALGPVRLALIPIGAFRFAPGQMQTDNHIGPREAVALFRRLGAAQGLGIHWGTFRLSDEARDTPPAMLRLFTQCAGLPEGTFAALPVGSVLDVPASRATPGPTRPARDCAEGSAALLSLP